MVTKAFEPLGGFGSLLGVSETRSCEAADYSVGFLLHHTTDFRVFFMIQFSMNSREIGSVWPRREIFDSQLKLGNTN